MRYTCDVEGCAGNFIELSDAWSRREQLDFWSMSAEDGAKYGALIRRKIIAIHLACIDAPDITTAEQFTETALETVDLRVFEWLRNVPIAHVISLGKLGEASGLRLYASSGESAALPNGSPTP